MSTRTAQRILRPATSSLSAAILARAARPFVLGWAAARRWAGAALLAGSILWGAPTALAQGTSDLFPEPISSEEMGSALDRIGIAGDARVTVLKSFEEYISRYLDLRKGDIETYLQGRAEPGSGEKSRDELNDRVSARERLLRRLAALDNQLFDSVAAAAGEQGSSKAARERLRAERRRDWAASNSFMGRSSRVELAELLDDVLARNKTALPEDVRAAVDAALEQHEQGVTSQHRKLLDLAVNEPLAMFDARAGANLRRPQGVDGKPPSSEEWSAFFRGMEEIRAKAREPQLEVRRAIKKANRDAAERVASLLPASVAQAFRDAFMNKAYPSAASPRDPSPSLLSNAREAADKGSLDAEGLKRVEDLVAAHVVKRNALNGRIGKAIDDERAESDAFSFIVVNGDDSGSEEKKPESEKLLAERGRLDQSLTDAVKGVSEELVATREGGTRTLNIGGSDISLPAGATFETTSIMVVGTAIGGDGGDGGEPIIFSESFGPDEDGPLAGAFTIEAGPRVGVVQPMQPTWVDRIAKQFAIPEDQVSVLRLLFDDYRGRCREVEEGDLAELKSLPSAMGGIMVVSGPDEQATPPKATSESVRRRHELRRTITDRIIALDRDFFEGLGAACGDHVPAADALRLRHERERSAYIAADNAGGGMFFGGFGSSKAPTVDLAEVLRNATLDQASRDAIKARFDAWDVAATDAFRSRYTDRVAAQEAQEEFERKMQEQSAAEGRPGEVRVTSGDGNFEHIQAMQDKARKADDMTRSLSEGAVEDMIAALSGDEAKLALRDAWNRAVWPQVFRDKRDAAKKIDAAMALEDLGAEARSAIKAIAAEHATEYRRLCDEMIAANEEATKNKPSGPDGGIAFDPAAMRKRQETINRLTFERDELNEKTVRRLKEQLTTEQAGKVGDLPSRKKPGGGFSLPGGGEAHIQIGG